jgi:hypothetical protein
VKTLIIALTLIATVFPAWAGQKVPTKEPEFISHAEALAIVTPAPVKDLQPIEAALVSLLIKDQSNPAFKNLKNEKEAVTADVSCVTATYHLTLTLGADNTPKSLTAEWDITDEGQPHRQVIDLDLDARIDVGKIAKDSASLSEGKATIFAPEDHGKAHEAWWQRQLQQVIVNCLAELTKK